MATSPSQKGKLKVSGAGGGAKRAKRNGITVVPPHLRTVDLTRVNDRLNRKGN